MVEIREVKTKADRKIFVDLPNRFYMDNPAFVPAFFGDDMDDWDEKKNPAFEYCEARSWLALPTRCPWWAATSWNWNAFRTT